MLRSARAFLAPQLTSLTTTWFAIACLGLASLALAPLALAADKADEAKATQDNDELAIGDKAPAFELLGTDGEKHSLEAVTADNKATVVVFTCNSCPFAKAYEPVLLELAAQYAKRPVRFVLINSNSVKTKPDDSYEHMVTRAKEKEYPFPYLYDESQAVAKAYGARVTPHVFLVDAEGVCRYRGRIDDNAQRDQVKEHDLVNALDAILAGKEVPVTTTKAFGCSIKWKPASS